MSQITIDEEMMSKEEFLALPKEKKKSLIARAHYYWYNKCINEHFERVREKEVRRFMKMLVYLERVESQKRIAALGVN